MVETLEMAQCYKIVSSETEIFLSVGKPFKVESKQLKIQEVPKTDHIHSSSD